MDVRLPDGTVISNVPDGTTKADLVARLSKNGYDVSGFGEAAAPQAAAVSAGRTINSIPRQLGLTARYAMEGPANAAQIITEPLRYLTDKFVPERSRNLSNLVLDTAAPPKSTPLGVQATKLADWLGLPKPEGANERVVADATRLGFGTGGINALTAAAGSIAPTAARGGAAALDRYFAPSMRSSVAALSASPLEQLSGSAAAGLASGASREAGGDELMQGLAGFGGGLLGLSAPGAVNSITNLMRRATTPAMSNAQIDAQLTRTLNTVDADYSAIPERAKQALRTELRSSLQAGKELDPQAVRRYADITAVGGTPTRGMVSLDPVQITRERNLSKMAANASDRELQGLPRIENENNAALIRALNAAGGPNEVDPIAAGRLLSGNVLGTQQGLRSAEQAAWTTAKESPGYTQPIFPNALNDINRALGDEGLMPFMNPTISKYMEAFQTGQQPFTPQAYKNLQSMLSNEMATGGNPAAAAGLARRVLENSEMRPITNPGGRDFGAAMVTPQMADMLRARDAAPQNAIDAVNAARGATRQAYAYEESSPLVRSILSDGASSDPARIAQRFIIGGTPDEAADVAREVGPAGRETIKNALATYIKRESLSGASDEVGKVSQSRLNSTLRKIGNEKLSLFFSPEEVEQLGRASRVASYMQVQPAGSAVNNSNSGALVLGRGADLLSNLSKRLPVGKMFVSDPLESLNVSLSNRAAQNVRPSLLLSDPQDPAIFNLLAPGVSIGGLLAAPSAP